MSRKLHFYCYKGVVYGRASTPLGDLKCTRKFSEILETLLELSKTTVEPFKRFFFLNPAFYFSLHHTKKVDSRWTFEILKESCSLNTKALIRRLIFKAKSTFVNLY